MSSEKTLEEWVPKTALGKLVKEGKMTSMEEIIQGGFKIREPEIVKFLLPQLKTDVIGASIVQKQTDAGEKTRFRAIVGIGDESGWFSIGVGKASTLGIAIEKATSKALRDIIPVKLGCGSWECKCGQPHSLPLKTEGKSGSVRVVIIPGPQGLGLVAADIVKRLLMLAGVKDAWTKMYGSTATTASVAYAVYDALKKMYVLHYSVKRVS